MMILLLELSEPRNADNLTYTLFIYLNPSHPVA